MTDDVKFAKKRLVTPKTVYSGVVDVLQFADDNNNNNNGLTEKALEDVDALVCFNVSPLDLKDYCSTLATTKSSVKRVVFAVNCVDNNNNNEKFSGEGVTFSDSCELLQKAGIDYTILKYSDVRVMVLIIIIIIIIIII